MHTRKTFFAFHKHSNNCAGSAKNCVVLNWLLYLVWDPSFFLRLFTVFSPFPHARIAHGPPVRTPRKEGGIYRTSNFQDW